MALLIKDGNDKKFECICEGELIKKKNKFIICLYDVYLYG